MAGRILLLLSGSSDRFCFGCAAGILRIGETRLVRISLLFALCDGFPLCLGYRLAIQNSVLHFILLPLGTGLVWFVFATAPRRVLEFSRSWPNAVLLGRERESARVESPQQRHNPIPRNRGRNSFAGGPRARRNAGRDDHAVKQRPDSA